MRIFYFVLWQDDLDQPLVDAVGAAAGGLPVVLSQAWNGMSKDGAAEDPPEFDVPAGVIELEWRTRGPGSAMQLAVYARPLPADVGVAEFGRRLARALGRPLLFSDCHVFPLSYFMAREDGAILHVVVRDDDGMALLPDDPKEPDSWERDVLFAPSQPLPMPADDLRADPPERCGVFTGACPKRTSLCVRLSAR